MHHAVLAPASSTPSTVLSTNGHWREYHSQSEWSSWRRTGCSCLGLASHSHSPHTPSLSLCRVDCTPSCSRWYVQCPAVSCLRVVQHMCADSVPWCVLNLSEHLVGNHHDPCTTPRMASINSAVPVRDWWRAGLPSCQLSQRLYTGQDTQVDRAAGVASVGAPARAKQRPPT